jgi:hypothetical protein
VQQAGQRIVPADGLADSRCRHCVIRTLVISGVTGKHKGTA